VQAPGNASALTVQVAGAPAAVLNGVAAVYATSRKQAEGSNPPPVSASIVVAALGDGCAGAGGGSKDAGAGIRSDLVARRGSPVPVQVVNCGVRIPMAQANSN
jgi:hypothetical protein